MWEDSDFYLPPEFPLPTLHGMQGKKPTPKPQIIKDKVVQTEIGPVPITATDESIIAELAVAFDHYQEKPNIEIEARLCVYRHGRHDYVRDDHQQHSIRSLSHASGYHCDTSLPKESWDAILWQLTAMGLKPEPVKVTKDDFTRAGMRFTRDPITNEVMECVSKQKLHKHDIVHPHSAFDIRVGFATENPIADKTAPSPGDITNSRRKERTSFIMPSKRLRVDMTIVDGKDFEVEIEALYAGVEADELFYLARCLSGLATSMDYIITTSPPRPTNALLDNLWRAIGERPRKSFGLIGPKPIAFRRFHLGSMKLTQRHVGEKTNGERMYLYLCSDNSSYLIDNLHAARQLEIRPFSLMTNKSEETVLDGELLLSGGTGGVFVAFDALVLEGEKLVRQPMGERMAKLAKWLPQQQQQQPSDWSRSLQVTLKQFVAQPLAHDALIKKLVSVGHGHGYQETRQQIPRPNDGLVLSDFNAHGYLSNDVLKWKWLGDQTVDWQPVPPLMKGAFGLECGAAAKGWGDDQITLGHIHITPQEFETIFEKGRRKTLPPVVECSFDDEMGLWRIRHIRSDKAVGHGNFVTVAMDVIKALVEKVTLREVLSGASSDEKQDRLPSFAPINFRTKRDPSAPGKLLLCSSEGKAIDAIPEGSNRQTTGDSFRYDAQSGEWRHMLGALNANTHEQIIWKLTHAMLMRSTYERDIDSLRIGRPITETTKHRWERLIQSSITWQLVPGKFQLGSDFTPEVRDRMVQFLRAVVKA